MVYQGEWGKLGEQVSFHLQTNLRNYTEPNGEVPQSAFPVPVPSFFPDVVGHSGHFGIYLCGIIAQGSSCQHYLDNAQNRERWEGSTPNNTVKH